MEAFQTANKMFHYNQKFYGKTLDTWIQNAHKYNCEKNNWKYYPLQKGAFGYDNLAISIGYVFLYYNFDNVYSKIIVADLIHQGWSINYLYWRDYNPQNNSEYKYIAPYKSLNDERRNICANTQFLHLDKEEKDKDYIIADFIFDEMQKFSKK